LLITTDLPLALEKRIDSVFSLQEQLQSSAEKIVNELIIFQGEIGGNENKCTKKQSTSSTEKSKTLRSHATKLDKNERSMKIVQDMIRTHSGMKEQLDDLYTSLNLVDEFPELKGLCIHIVTRTRCQACCL
jgi:hypothetical protein